MSGYGIRCEEFRDIVEAVPLARRFAVLWPVGNTVLDTGPGCSRQGSVSVRDLTVLDHVEDTCLVVQRGFKPIAIQFHSDGYL